MAAMIRPSPKPPAFGGLLHPLIPSLPPTTRVLPPEAVQRTRAPTAVSEQQVTVAGDNALLPLLFGRQRVGAKVTLITVYQNVLVLRLAWLQGEIDGFDAFEINDAALPAGSASVPAGTTNGHWLVGPPTGVRYTHYTGAAGQVVDTTLAHIYAAQGKTYADTLPGVAYTVLSVPQGVVSGFPRAAATLRGLRVPSIELGCLALNGTTQSASVAHGSQNTINEDFEAALLLAAADWTPTADQVLLSKWDTTGNQRGWRLILKTTGALALEVSTSGTSGSVITYTSSATLQPAGAPSAFSIRVRFAKSSSGSSRVRFATSSDGQRWTALGAEQTAATIGTVHGSTAPLRLGADAQGNYFAGSVWSARVVTVQKWVCDLAVIEATPGASSFVDAVGASWTFSNITVPSHTVYSRTPSNALAAVLANSVWGVGRRVDPATWLQARDYNAGLVGTPAEPRHELDRLLGDSRTPDQWVGELASYAHCRVVPDGDRYLLVRDFEDDTAHAFDESNVVAGTLDWFQRGARDTPTVVEVTYTDTSAVPWRDGVVSAYRDGVLAGTVPRRTMRVARPGITRHSEANRYAIEELNASTVSNLSVRFRTFDEGLGLREGAIFTLTHPIGFSGKKFRCSQPPVAVEPGRWQIEGDEYDPAKWSSVVVPGPTSEDTTLPSPSSPPAVSGLAMVEEYYQEASHGKWTTRLRASWTPADWAFASSSLYHLRLIQLGDAGEIVWEDTLVASTTYVSRSVQESWSYRLEVSVRGPVNEGVVASVTTLARGNLLPPTDVTGLTGAEAGGRVYLRWNAAVDVSTLRYEIRYGSTSATWDTATMLNRVDALAYLSEGLPAGLYRFFVKAFDSLGLYSANAATVDVKVLTDDSAFKALTFAPSSWSLLAARQFTRDGKTYAVTSWGDEVGYGHATINDATGTFNDGTVPSTTVLTQPHSQALRFNGSDTFVNIPHAAGLNVANTFSVDCKVYPTSLTGDRCIYNHGTGWYLYVGAGNGGTARVYLKSGAGAYVRESTDNAVTLNAWNHIAVTDSAGTFRLYVNGVEVSYAQSNAFTAADNSNAKKVGVDNGSGYFAGLISRVRLWSAALTADEVKRCRQYRGTNVTTVVNAGNLVAGNLKASWLLDDAAQNSASTTCADGKSVSSGTVNGAVLWRSWDEVESSSIDLGSIVASTFQVTHTPTALSGAVRVVMLLSSDNVTFYEQAVFTGQARYVRIRMQAEGGSALYNLTDTALRVNLTPRDEVRTVTTSATANVPAIVTLSGSYSESLEVLLQPKLNPSYPALTPLYDQIEVSGGRGILTGRSLRFNGLTGAANGCYVLVGDHPQFEFHNASNDLPFSVECWVKFDTIGSVQSFIAKGTGAPSGQWQLRIRADGTFALILVDTTAGDMVTIATSLAFQAGVRYHVAATYSGANPHLGGVKIYINGKQEATSATFLIGSYGRMRDSTEPLVLGNQSNGATYNSPLTGVLDEVRIWNVVRTAQQIADNMNGPVAANASGLVGYWKFDETSGFTAVDSQTNTTQRNGTLGTGTTFNNVATNTEKWWRPADGFDVYCFGVPAGGGAPAQVANEVKCFWKGA